MFPLCDAGRSWSGQEYRSSPELYVLIMGFQLQLSQPKYKIFLWQDSKVVLFLKCGTIVV